MITSIVQVVSVCGSYFCVCKLFLCVEVISVTTLKDFWKHYKLNLIPHTLFWDCPKFKEAVDDNWIVAIKEF